MLGGRGIALIYVALKSRDLDVQKRVSKRFVFEIKRGLGVAQAVIEICDYA